MGRLMKIILDNAQNTPHLDFVDSNGKITAQLSICADGLLITGSIPAIPYCFPYTDGIVLFEGCGELHPDWIK